MFVLGLEKTECRDPLVKCFNATVMAHVMTPKADITDFIHYLLNAIRISQICHKTTADMGCV